MVDVQHPTDSGPRILIVRLSAIGDIIHGLPVADFLKRALPGAEITWLTERLGVELLQGNAAIDRMMVFPKKDWLAQVKSGQLLRTAGDARQFAKNLQSLKFHAAIDLQGLFKSSFLAFTSGAPLRFGFKGTREGAQNFLTHAVKPSGDYFGNDRHIVDLNLDIAQAAARKLAENFESDKLFLEQFAAVSTKDGTYIYDPDKVTFPLPAPPVETAQKVEALIKKGSASSDAGQHKVVAIIPGTTWATKIWQPDRWRQLADALCAQTGCRIVIVGGPGEQQTNREIAEELSRAYPERIVDLTGQTSLLDLVALFQTTDLTIGGDTGPLHLAAATGHGQVAGIFGSTPERRNGPYGKHCRTICLTLPCQPCFEKKCPLGTIACLVDLSPQQVLSEVAGLL